MIICLTFFTFIGLKLISLIFVNLWQCFLRILMNFFEVFNSFLQINESSISDFARLYGSIEQFPEQCSYLVNILKTISRIRPQLRNTLADMVSITLGVNKSTNILHFIQQYEVDHVYFVEDAKFYRACLIKKIVDVPFVVSKFINTRESLIKKAIPIFAPYIEKKDLPSTKKYAINMFKGDRQEIIEEALYGAPLNSLQSFLQKDDIDNFQKKFIMGGDFNQNVRVDGKEMSLLSAAAFFNAVKCFKYILLNEAKPSQETLYNAVISGSLEIIHILQEQVDLKAALEASIIFYRPEIFEWLCDHHLDDTFCKEKAIEVCRKEQESASFVAIALIEDSYLDIDKASLVKEAAFQAIERGFLAKLMLLSSLPDFDFGALNEDGNNMAIVAAGGRSIDILKFILGIPKIDPNFISHNGMTAVRRAIRKSTDNLAEILKVASKDIIYDGLKYAAQKEYIECMEMLLERTDVPIEFFADIPKQSIDFLIGRGKLDTSRIEEETQRTLLHIFVDKGYPEVIHSILSSKLLDVNSKDAEGNTPLHIAVRNSDSNIIRILLDFGACKTITNNKNLTPAQMTRNMQIKRLISRYSNE